MLFFDSTDYDIVLCCPKHKVPQLLHWKHVSSTFIPKKYRFLYDNERVKPRDVATKTIHH